MANDGALATVRRDQRTEIARVFWQILSSTGVLVVVGAAVFTLFLCAILVRQMPGQIADDPAAATRWLLTVTEEYGVFGGVLRALGLFDVLHNPLLQLLLAVIALVLLVHLGNMLAALWRFRQVADWVKTPVAGAGDPIRLPPTQPLYRLRQPAASSPAEIAEQLAAALRSYFDEILIVTVKTKPYHEEAPTNTLDTVSTAEGAIPTDAPADAPDAVAEFRLLARRHQNRWHWLRPLLVVGLLLALGAVWIILLAGWEVTPPLLAPGDEYRATTQRVVFVYALPAEDLPTEEAVTPSLSAEINEATYQLPLGGSQQLWWGQITIEANPGPPALLIRSADEATTLSRFGQAQHGVDLGLIFPSLGSEESVVVDNRVGLRIVRIAVPSVNGSPLSLNEISPEQFLVEVYPIDEAKPVQTIYIREQMQDTIQVGGETRKLTFIPLPSIAAAVRYQPGVWLLWIGFFFVIVGAVSLRYQPAFLIVQIAPWPLDRSVLIVQSDVATEIDRIRLYLK